MPHLDNMKTEYLSDEELTRLMEVLDNWPFDDSAAFIRLAIYTGLRRGEIFKLTWDAVDLERGMVTLANPKGKRTTTILLNSLALDVLRGLHRTSPFCFPGKNGGMRVDFKSPWHRIRKAAKLPEDFRFCGLRHHYASALVSNGVDINFVRELLTHKNVSTTMRYAHLMPGAVADAVAKSNEILSVKKPEQGRILNLA
jgi:integrase